MENVFVTDVGSHSIKYGTVRRAKRGNTTTFSGTQQSPTIVENTCRSMDYDAADDANPFSCTSMGTFSQQMLQLLNGSPCNASEYTLMLMISPLATMRFKELLVRAAFEELAAKRVFIGYSACLSLFGAGTTSGLVVDVGYHGTTICPVSNATPAFPFVERIPHQGMASVDAAIASACASDISFPPPAELMAKYSSTFLHSVKAECCSLAAGLRTPPTGSALPTLTLPDGTALRCPLSAEQYVDCCRPLVEGTSLLFSVQQAARNVIKNTPTWQSSYMLIGGGAALPGVESYFLEGLSCTPRVVFGTTKDLVHQQCRDPVTAAWTGASICAQLSIFPGMCMDREGYEESGPREALRYNMSDSR
ncbi:actin-like protein, putative [Bodo saltans]|uniref:Actin-like protein, putative n=1 Tax=Bodo saltans TaxID=75058 RepID=A0A0S4KG45_BODSA|nr:actin-like protein, putative [Bodo saltans]|eukprot:CUI12380.1 actin-like protein, putative [Bodo saltans]